MSFNPDDEDRELYKSLMDQVEELRKDVIAMEADLSNELTIDEVKVNVNRMLTRCQYILENY